MSLALRIKVLSIKYRNAQKITFINFLRKHEIDK